jgi:hypothetical protein
MGIRVMTESDARRQVCAQCECTCYFCQAPNCKHWKREPDNPSHAMFPPLGQCTYNRKSADAKNNFHF